MLSSYLIWLLGAAYSVYRLALAIYNERYSPLRDLPGPPNPSRIYGHLWQIINAAHSTMQEKWVREYGTTLKTKGLFNVRLSIIRQSNTSQQYCRPTGFLLWT